MECVYTSHVQSKWIPSHVYSETSHTDICTLQIDVYRKVNRSRKSELHVPLYSITKNTLGQPFTSPAFERTIRSLFKCFSSTKKWYTLDGETRQELAVRK